MQPDTNVFIRLFSIIAYFFIFLQGSMILLPFCLLLINGPFSGEPIMRILILLADISLIVLFIFCFKKVTRVNLIVDIVAFILLLLPLIKIFTSFPFEMFNYFLFIFPAICFIILFVLSIVLSYRGYRKSVVTHG